MRRRASIGCETWDCVSTLKDHMQKDQAEYIRLNAYFVGKRSSARSSALVTRPQRSKSSEIEMSSQARNDSTHLLQGSGPGIVRRFTDELKGESNLERATISAQQRQDETERLVERRRMEALYKESGSHLNSFHEIEAARLALEKACKDIEQDESKQSVRARLKTWRSARATANKAVTESIHDFMGLQAVVSKFESEWKGQQSKVSAVLVFDYRADGHNKVGQRFRRVCQKLDDHKAAFAVLPSQDMYTSTICGSLALIVTAAVNHNDIAEKLSEMVDDITEQATRAAELVKIHRTKHFRELFSDLYAQVFRFYRDAIEWYAKSKLVKVIESFNANLVKPYEKAAAKIEGIVIQIYRQGEVARSALMAVFAEDLGYVLRQQRHQKFDKDDLLFAGREGQRLLLVMHESAFPNEALSGPKADRLVEAEDDQKSADLADGLLDREETKALSERLAAFVSGTEGPSLFEDGTFWLPEIAISFKLSKWMSPDEPHSVLWISSSEAAQDCSGSRAAALITLAAAWESQMPIISHFCARPCYGDLSQGRTVEQVGLIGLVYSLIIQLLQFNVKRDSFGISRDAFDQLDGSDESWPNALLLLQDLLRLTPQLQRCIIDGLNNLCFFDGEEWCGSFLEVLLEHQRSNAPRFKILFTTTGQSRVLPHYVQLEDRVFMQSEAQEVIRGGKWIKAVNR